MKPQRVLCVTPMGPVQISQVVENWHQIDPRPVAWVFQTGSYLPEAHNRCFKDALKLSGWDRLLMLEDDMIVSPKVVARTRTHEADIVSGLYFGRRYPPGPMCWKATTRWGRGVNLNHMDIAQLLEAPAGEHPVGAVATGIVSVARHVVELMPEPWFEPSPEALAEGHYGGHDIYFSAKAAAQGFSIALDTSPLMLAGHVGTNMVDLRNYVAWMRSQERKDDDVGGVRKRAAALVSELEGVLG